MNRVAYFKYLHRWKVGELSLRILNIFPKKRAVTFFAVSQQKNAPALRQVAWHARTVKPELSFFWAFRKRKQVANVVFSQHAHRTERTSPQLTHRTERCFSLVSAKCQATSDTH